MAIGKKTGGRQKGTPNKITAMAKDMMEKWLALHASTPDGKDESIIEEDFWALDARDRVRVSVEFIKAVTPRDLKINQEENETPFEKHLAQLAEENEQ